MNDGDTVYVYTKWNQSILRVKLQRSNPAGCTVQWEDGNSSTIDRSYLVSGIELEELVRTRKHKFEKEIQKALLRAKQFTRLLEEDDNLLKGRAG